VKNLAEGKEKLSFYNVKTKAKESTDEWNVETFNTKHGKRTAAVAKGRDGTKMFRFLPSKSRA
jgi:hypothetical protein